MLPKTQISHSNGGIVRDDEFFANGAKIGRGSWSSVVEMATRVYTRRFSGSVQ